LRRWLVDLFIGWLGRFEGFLARIIQHELDHLSGDLLVDHGEQVLVEQAGDKFGLREVGEEEEKWIEKIESTSILSNGDYDKLAMKNTFNMSPQQIDEIIKWMEVL